MNDASSMGTAAASWLENICSKAGGTMGELEKHTVLLAMSNPLNAFSGKSALVDYYNPDCNPPPPLVELPDHPFVEDGVRIYAKMMTALPAGNVKALPALNILLRGREQESITSNTHKIIEYSSGNTVISLSIIANILGIGSTCAYISNETSQAKINLLRTLFGGPAQVEPADVNGGIFAALKDGREQPTVTALGNTRILK
ncbi:hypothetical protein FRC10_004052 [Ceratobasidium sp. 414]|nr:hypothetical protein FRC10_004052 [Ceratobasidium sp. 414]